MPCVHPDDRRDPRYVGDAVIRTYRRVGLSRLLADLGWPADTAAVRVTGGIGTLLLRTDADALWHPALAPVPSVVPITPEQAAQRNATCRTCPRYRPESDRCGLCGCAFVIAERVVSPVACCPEAHW